MRIKEVQAGLLLKLLDQVIEVRSPSEEVLEELGAAYPTRAEPGGRADLHVACAPVSEGLRLNIEPSTTLDELFPLALGERFDRKPGEVLDLTSKVGFKQLEEALLARGPALRTLDVGLLHLSLLCARRRGRDPVLFHGAAFAPPAEDGKALLLFGLSGSGKSTLSAALCREGAAYFSDEVVGVEGEEVLGYPRAISLRERPSEPSREYVSARGETKYLVDPRRLGSPRAPSRARVWSLVLLEPYGEQVVIQELSPADAAVGLLPHVYTGREAPPELLLKMITFCAGLRCLRVRPGSPGATARKLLSLVTS